MEVEIVGLVAFALGLLTVFLGARPALIFFAVSGVLGAAAAFKLSSVGGASVPPSHLLLVFLALAGLRDASVRRYLLETVAFPRAGFWFLLVVAYSLVSAVFMPRIFTGATTVFVLGRAPTPLAAIQLAPLAPSPTNVTQAVYMVGDLVCFVLASAMVMAGYTRTVVWALTIAAFVHILLAIVDVASFAVGIGDALSFLRNGGYKMLADNEIKGFKRIVGGFTEAGAYTYVAVGFYAFALQLWLHNVRPKLNGALTLVLGMAILLATSSTAYVTFALYSLIVYAQCVTRIRMGSTRNLIYLAAGPVAVGLFVMGLMLVPAAWEVVSNLFDVTLAKKLNSSSGVERTAWNSLALKNFFDTAGLGAGLGSVRTSSFAVALLSNVGAIGTALFGIFFYTLLRPPGERTARDPDLPVRQAARSACIAILISAVITLGNIDLGIFFTLFAALGTTRRHEAGRAVGEPVFRRMPVLIAAPIPRTA
ncbi:MAG: hypothetical protein ABW179_12150 [Methylobacterium sp.]